VKDVLREYGRTVAIFAAAGLVLSLLVGLLAGNPFGVMIVRAILFAILFGGMGAGMQYMVRRFLPELAGRDAAETAGLGGGGAEARPEGSTIDIVLPEEPPPAGAAADERAEPLEELPGMGEGASAVEELDGTEPAAEAAPAPASAPAAPYGGPIRGKGGLDALPDIGLMSGDAAPVGQRSEARMRPASARAKPADAAREVLERQDPALLARGLRTILKRDERA
jgi:hypothetical protein